ncbi:MAG: VWA domain-containing protein [Gammaproteobacteria bacterium]|nr:VWA domain-containing protein [Gammaproteobacteria bacterium]
MKPLRRREIEQFSLSFLDVICCGFGAIVLLLIITKTMQPMVLEKSTVDLDGQVAAKREAVNTIQGQTRTVKRQISDEQDQLDKVLELLARARRELSEILGEFATTSEQADQQQVENSRLVAARQSLSEEMTRLLGAGFTRQDNVIGGITVDSEYIIFVIDTSGSMQSAAWPHAIRKVSETLNIYPDVKGIQVMNDMGDYMFPNYADEWIPDSPERRREIMMRLSAWAPYSNSSPVEGIEHAIRTFWAPDKKISIYVFGDDFSTRDTIEEVVDRVDIMNAAGEDGSRRVRIHGVGFPVIFQVTNQPTSGFRYAALMRELTFRNDGTFVGLPGLQ